MKIYFIIIYIFLNEKFILQILQFVSSVSLDESFGCKKEEEIVDLEKDWLSAEQEKQLASILNETNGWKKLAQHFNIDYLLESVEHPYNASLLLLSYITVRYFFFIDCFALFRVHILECNEIYKLLNYRISISL